VNTDRIRAIVCMIFVRPVLYMGQCRKEKGRRANKACDNTKIYTYIYNYYFSYSFAYHHNSSSDHEQAKA